jgi:hypothetical protein
MNSHEYAKRLRQCAELLESRPAFDWPNYVREGLGLRVETLHYCSDKDGFIAAVRALGAGSKHINNDSIPTQEFVVGDNLFAVSVDRDKVCRIVKPAQPAEYECLPLLSQEGESPFTDIEVGRG